MTAADRASQLSTPVFDASIWEVWPYLSTGACVALVDDETRSSPAALLALLAARRITFSFIPTPLLEVMLDEEGARTGANGLLPVWDRCCGPLQTLLRLISTTAPGKHHRGAADQVPCRGREIIAANGPAL